MYCRDVSEFRKIRKADPLGKRPAQNPLRNQDFEKRRSRKKPQKTRKISRNKSQKSRNKSQDKSLTSRNKSQ